MVNLSLDDNYDNTMRILYAHLEEYIRNEVDTQIKEKLKDWEPTQNIKLTVEVVNGKDH